MHKPKFSITLATITLFVMSCCMHPIQTNAFTSNEMFSQPLDFFVGSWDQACEMAEARQKPLFVYIYVSYERESNQMNDEVFVDEQVKNFYDANFVNYKISLHSQKGTYFRQKYQLRDYPALLYFDQKKNLITQDSGLKSINEFIRIGNYAIKSNAHLPIAGVISPIYTNFIEKKMQYDNGVRHSDFLYNLAYDLKKFNDSFQPIVHEYIEKEGVSNLTKSKHLNFIFDFADDIYSQPFEILLANKQRYIDFFGKEKVDDRIKRAIRSAVIVSARYQNWEAFEMVKQTIEQAQLSDKKEFEFLMLSVYYENTNNWTDFTLLVEKFTRQHLIIDAEILNDLAWRYAVHIDDKSKLQEALNWSEKAMSLQPDKFKYRETYSALLYALGKKSKALKEADTAMVIARKNGGDYTTTIKLSQAIRSEQSLPKDLN
ncbi:MAG: thioredoxin family protein [Chitinophagales bacterium]